MGLGDGGGGGQLSKQGPNVPYWVGGGGGIDQERGEGGGFNIDRDSDLSWTSLKEHRRKDRVPPPLFLNDLIFMRPFAGYD